MREYVFNVRCYDARSNKFFGKKYSVYGTNEKDAFIRATLAVYDNLTRSTTLDSIQLVTIIER